MNVTNINSIPKIESIQSNMSNSSSKVNFSDFMNEALGKVNSLQKESTDITNKFITGEVDNIHSVMIAGSKADLALQMTLQVRNKVMDAYNEVMNMQI